MGRQSQSKHTENDYVILSRHKSNVYCFLVKVFFLNVQIHKKNKERRFFSNLCMRFPFSRLQTNMTKQK